MSLNCDISTTGDRFEFISDRNTSLPVWLTNFNLLESRHTQCCLVEFSGSTVVFTFTFLPFRWN